MPELNYLLDVNVLVALTNTSHVHHDRGHRWLGRIKKSGTWATTPLTESALLRLMLNPLVAGTSVRPATALRVLGALREIPEHRFLEDNSSLADPVIALDRLIGSTQVTDLHLVNLAAGNGSILATFDAKIRNALAPDDQQHIEVIAP